MRIFTAFLFILFVTACAAYPVIPAKRLGQTIEEHEKLRVAAESGDLDAQYEYGWSYCCGQGALYDNRVATKWMCSAAKKEHTKSMVKIADLYKGKLISLPGYEKFVKRLPSNDKIALAWYIVADQKGDPDGKKGIDIFRFMEFSDVVEAIDLSRKYPEIPCEVER